MYNTRSPLRIEFEIDMRWLKYGATILAGLGFAWLVLVILRAVLSAANDVVVTVQHSSPILQMIVAAVLTASMLMVIMRLGKSIVTEWRGQRGGAI